MNSTTTTYLRALRTVAQSIGCHRDWDLETHLAYLQCEGFDLDEMLTRTSWPHGPSTHPLRAYVKSWVTYPDRCIEWARNAA